MWPTNQTTAEIGPLKTLKWRLKCIVVLSVDYFDIACSYLVLLTKHINCKPVNSFFKREDVDIVVTLVVSGVPHVKTKAWSCVKE